MTVQKRNVKVLVVDEDEIVCAGLGELLRDEGFSPVCAVNAEDARKAATEEDLSLVFMDIVMEGGEGLKLFRTIRSLRPEAPVVMYTGAGRGHEDIIKQAIAEGLIDDDIRKPFFARDIVRAALKYAA